MQKGTKGRIFRHEGGQSGCYRRELRGSATGRLRRSGHPGRNDSLVMKLILVLCAALLVGFATPSHAAASATAELHLAGKVRVLSEQAQQALCLQAIQLVETSNFHSDPGDHSHIFKRPQVQSDYRREVAGKFLLIGFPTPRKIKTIGGEITVSEIVVGLNRDGFASSLFTIDDSGRVIGHAKYSGERCIQLLNAVRQFAPEA